MIKYLLFFSFTILNLFAISQFESSQTCKVCHPIIYNEHFNSAHSKASVFKDPIHNAVWNIHPAKAKEKYKCAKCHTPNDKTIITALKDGTSALPKRNKAQQEGVSCASCHNIKDVETHVKANKNIITSSKKKLFSARVSEKNNADKKYSLKITWLGTTRNGSPFHDIDFTNKNFYNGNVCTGCHSHKQNEHKLDVCNMNLHKNKNTEKENCITCHMPEVQGSFSTLKSSKTHRYHGFTGTMHKPHMLTKYVKLELKQTLDGFDIIITNKANHDLLLHPLRVGELQINIQRDTKKIKLKPVKFIRIIGKYNKTSMPWMATKVLKNNQIKAKEKRVIHFKKKLLIGDNVEIKLGHHIVNPKAAKKLGLDTHKKLTRFTLFKQKNITIR